LNDFRTKEEKPLYCAENSADFSFCVLFIAAAGTRGARAYSEHKKAPSSGCYTKRLQARLLTETPRKSFSPSQSNHPKTGTFERQIRTICRTVAF